MKRSQRTIARRISLGGLVILSMSVYQVNAEEWPRLIMAFERPLGYPVVSQVYREEEWPRRPTTGSPVGRGETASESGSDKGSPPDRSEGKCGEGKMKKNGGKCGEGKCGEGKCGSK